MSIPNCPVCGAEMYLGDCPQCRERETVIDAEVVSADEWQGIESRKTKEAVARAAQDRATEDLDRIAAGLHFSQGISVIVHCDLINMDNGFNAEAQITHELLLEHARNPVEKPLRTAHELLMAEMDAVLKRNKKP